MIARPAAAVIGLIAIGLALNVYAAVALKMHRVVPGWYVTAIPAALSNLRFGHPADYSALADVRDVFDIHATALSSDAVNAGIRAVLEMPRSSIGRERYFIGTDDKGVVDFVKFSFLLFGYRAEGLLSMYFLLLGISAAAFVAHFHQARWPLTLVAAFLAAHYAVLPTVGLNPQLTSVLALRFMTVAATLAYLHFILVAARREALRPVAVASVLVQTAVLIFVLHMRSSALWQLAVVIGAAGAIALAGLRRGGRAHAESRCRPWRAAVLVLWPVVPLLVGYSGLMLYQRAAYAPEYRADYIDTRPGATIRSSSSGHVFWHSLFSGLAVHPQLAEEYQIRLDDVSVIRATGEFLRERGRSAEWAAMGGDSPGFRDIKFGRYDVAVREMLVATCSRQWVLCMESVMIEKPALLARYARWFTGLQKTAPRPELVDETVQSELIDMGRRMQRERRHVNYFRPAAVLLLAAVGAVLFAAVLGAVVPLAICALLVVVCSLVPNLLVYPVAHTVGDALVAVGMAVSVAIIVAAAWLTQIVLTWRR